MDPLTLSFCHMKMPKLGMSIFTQLTDVSIIFTTAIIKPIKLIPLFLEFAIGFVCVKGPFYPIVHSEYENRFIETKI